MFKRSNRNNDKWFIPVLLLGAFPALAVCVKIAPALEFAAGIALILLVFEIAVVCIVTLFRKKLMKLIQISHEKDSQTRPEPGSHTTSL